MCSTKEAIAHISNSHYLKKKLLLKRKSRTQDNKKCTSHTSYEYIKFNYYTLKKKEKIINLQTMKM